MMLSPEERMRRARAAQQAWAERPMRQRVRVLRGLRREFAAQREALGSAVRRDTGKPRLDALGGDVLVTLEHMRFYEWHAAKILRKRRVGRSRVLYGRAEFYELHEPHGVALIFGAANYPLQLSMVPAITALFAGNAVILKCSEQTPETARAIELLCRRAQLPADLLQVVTDAPSEAGAYIDAHPDILFFTGSAENGRRVAAHAGLLLIPTVMELGGKDAALVFNDCHIERALEGVVYGAFAHAGQVCVAVKRLYVQRGIYAEFVARLKSRIAQLRIDNEDNCELGVMRSETARARIAAQIEDALTRGATLEWPDRVDAAGEHPVVLSDVRPASRLLMEESFGPVLCVAPFETEEHAIELANGSPFALGASVWTGDLQRARRVAAALNAGNCAVNDVIRNIANPHAAFGGNAMSGYGRYHGAAGLQVFSRTKSVMVASGTRMRERNWFPLTEKSYRGLNMLIELRHRPRGVAGAIRRLLSLGCMGALFVTGAGAQAAQPHLRLHVNLPRDARGEIAYLVFASPDGFPQDRNKALRHGFVAPERNTVDIDAGALPPGRYAVSVYLDENGNHKLDTGLLGIPKEPVGVSNRPRHRFGPPRFEECAFQFGGQDETVEISLVRP